MATQPALQGIADSLDAVLNAINTPNGIIPNTEAILNAINVPNGIIPNTLRS
jgi:hypothetical protein